VSDTHEPAGPPSAAGADGPVEAFLDQLESPAPAPSGGTASATVAAMAAALVVMVGRGSPGWPEGSGVAAQARALRARLTALGEEDARAYAAVHAAMRNRATPGSEARDFGLGLALTEAAEVPLRIAAAAADVAELAALAAAEGKHSLRPDAAAAVILAEAAVRAATHLVDVNLATLPGDERSDRAARIAEAAETTRARALGAM
jgi:formiminotetrahydrofolate cyclodeaminase